MTLRGIDPLNKVPFKRARSRVQKGPPLRGLPHTTQEFSAQGFEAWGSGPQGGEGSRVFGV